MPSAPTLTAAAVLTTAALAGASAWAGLSATSQLFGPILIAPLRPSEILLTFDDGPNPIATPRLLEVLARHGVHATFFLIGTFSRREPALLREIASAGHTIGNHTETHPWLQFLPERRIRHELTSCNQALQDILGTPVTLFRPPHGARRPAVLRIARSLGLIPVNWNVIAQDWKPDPAEAILHRLQTRIARVRRRGHAANIVLHDGGHTALGQPRLATVEAVDRLLTSLRAQKNPPTFVLPNSWLPLP